MLALLAKKSLVFTLVSAIVLMNISAFAWEESETLTTKTKTTVAEEWITSTISVSGDHSMAVKADGTLWTWGSNEYGVLGNGKANVISSFNPEDRFDEYVPIQIMDEVASVSAGRFHSMAIRTDGSLWAWGNNEQGQLGDGTKTVRAYDEEGFPYYAEMNDKHVPMKILDDVASVSAGTHHTLALKTDGTLWAWGWNDRGQLGTGSTEDSYIPVQIMSDVISISAGSKHSLAVKIDGTLWAWGSNTSGQIGDGTRTLEYLDESYNLITIENNDKLKPIQIMDDALMVSAGEGYSMAIKADGTLYAWGNNMNGKLGNGFMTVLDDFGKPKEDHNEVLPVQIMNDVAFVSAGGTHCLAIKNDGTLWAWGWNFMGQVGDGTGLGENDISILMPVQIMDDVAAASAGYLHNMAVKKDGTLWTWGFNNVGQLGDGTTTGWTENGTYNNRNSTVPIKITDGITIPTAVNKESFVLSAVPTIETIYIDGNATEFYAYIINGEIHFKLRDIAFVLSDSYKQFDVVFDTDTRAIKFTHETPYNVSSSDMTSKGDDVKYPVLCGSRIYVDDLETSLTAFTIEGHNYVKLIELARIIDFNVSYDSITNIYSIETVSGYMR